ncbi:protein CHLOROPLAST IMPORT APPARATUS 2-like isoform X2 [Wolffia australiana]
MSSCLSGGRAYGFDLEMVVKPSSSSSPTSSSRSTTQSSPSSTLSEACNSPLAISTKRARGPRKRPNQTYNEAAALLSTAYPAIFPAEPLPSHRRAISEPGLVLRAPALPAAWPAPAEPPAEDDDFDAESILDEEVGEGIDSIMGNLSFCSSAAGAAAEEQNPLLGYGVGGLLKLRQGLRRALKRGDEGEWWRTPAVEVVEIAPKRSASPEKKKKKKKAVAPPEEEAAPPPLSLRLNYDDVALAWSGRGSPFSDSTAKGEKIELFPEAAGGGGVREASVLRYKEKRRSRLFSKKIRYQVRKVNADRRPRMKGRFVRRPSLTVA